MPNNQLPGGEILKNTVAKNVRDKLDELAGKTVYDFKIAPDPDPYGVMRVTKVTNLVTHISVRTPGGPRYFEVIVKEDY